MCKKFAYLLEINSDKQILFSGKCCLTTSLLQNGRSYIVTDLSPLIECGLWGKFRSPSNRWCWTWSSILTKAVDLAYTGAYVRTQTRRNIYTCMWEEWKILLSLLLTHSPLTGVDARNLCCISVKNR